MITWGISPGKHPMSSAQGIFLMMILRVLVEVLFLCASNQVYAHFLQGFSFAAG